MLDTEESIITPSRLSRSVPAGSRAILMSQLHQMGV